MTVFIQVMLPVLLIFFTGFIFQKFFYLDIKPLSTIAIYLLLPFLVFQTFYSANLNNSFSIVVLVSTGIMIILILLGVLVGKIIGFNKKKMNAFLLSTVFPNSGNYGVPIVLFAFGNKSVEYAMTIMVIHNILMGVVGVYIASYGDVKGLEGVKKALLAIFKQPMNYVILPAILLNYLNCKIPNNIMGSIKIIGNITIPLIMIILGMQLADTKIKKISWLDVSLASFFRLIISPIVAYMICILFSLGHMLTTVIVLMAAMPSAANTTMYAIQFDTEPDLVSTCTLVSTVFSVFTLTFLLIVL
ncbi:AEC family transporter [Ligilactobacillus pobuzihii]|uniref:AEC family transporter n=1 Tax=Ligilactobacillus pobuzihii TaxID=449659 RepID=A0A0R2LR92_9LACO|nr:AEC family transporter [Ligilactobacillus pobuzihii]KRK09509.1 hypothetical protein FD11_GL000743 [Ligilactobacillus pobuzihii E100301 = KCTC 13174]KRO01315.1 hypothetical protein IV66_GL000503 [Ligilactobacillus pobuzihii]GEN48903.1 membrane protein [Ligilactobacillus pobuzihii]